jgi:hypothetical protein
VTEHSHAGMAVPDEAGDRFGAVGQRVNGQALADVVGAAIDGCVLCQNTALDVVQLDALTLARLVELSAIAMMSLAGGLPDAMTSEADADSTLGRPFRAMLRAGVDLDDHGPMYAVAVGLSVAERRQAAEDALDMLTGILMMGGQ